MKKTMVIACLAVVALKMVYNIYSFVYDKSDANLERMFNYSMLFLIVYFSINAMKKKKKTAKQN